MVQRAIEYVGPEHQHLQPPQIAEVFPSETSSSCVVREHQAAIYLLASYHDMTPLSIYTSLTNT